MGQLDLKFLGNPEVYHSGQGVKFPTRKTLALLVYLVVEGGRQSRDTLTAMLWPESNTTQGRAALRNTLAYLRKALDDRTAAHLLIEREALGFDFASDFELDLNVVSTAVQTGLEQAIWLPMALNHYRADFLTGFSLSDAPEFEQWATVQREYWHRQINQVCERLLAQQSAAGDVTGVLDTLSRWLALDPLNEATYRRLMTLYLASGDREATRRTYEAYRAMLATEFGAEPAPETMALAESLRDLRLTIDNLRLTNINISPGLATALGSETTNRKSKTRTEQSRSIDNPKWLELPLVGRSPEYLKLVEIYHTVRRGQTQLVSLEGEAGIGKSRLAAEFLMWAVTEQADVVRGRAFEAGSRLPYQSIVDAWRERLEHENAPDDLLADVWLAELSRLLPELRERYPDLPVSSTDDTTAQTRLFEAIARLGLALAGRKTLILFIDDLHWTDVASLDLLHYLTRRWAESNAPVLLLFNLRSEALQPTASLAVWLTGLGRDCSLTRLNLHSLTLADTRQLVGRLTGQQETETAESSDRQFSDWLFKETGGQPFFLSETIKSLLENDRLRWQPQPGGHRLLQIPGSRLQAGQLAGFVSPGVRDIIRARLQQVAPTALHLLAAGAVLGHNFTFAALHQVADLPESEALTALDDLLARLFLQPGGADTSAVYNFTHDKIRDVVYTEAGDARRRVFHRRALAFLEEEATPAAELARHALAAGQLEAAFQHSLAAGHTAMSLFAIRDAIAHYEQARHQLSTFGNEQLPIANLQLPISNLQSLISNLYLSLGRAYELTGQMEQARTTYQALLDLARQTSQPESECVALNRLATLVVQSDFDLEAGRGYLTEAQRVAESSGDKAGLAETAWNLAQLGVYSSQPQVTLQHGQHALALARELDLNDLTARSLNVLALGCSDLGQYRQMEHYAAEAEALYTRQGNRAMQADCLGLMADARIHTGRTPAGIEAGRQALAIVQEIENPWGQVSTTIHLTAGLLDAGHYAEALTLAGQAVMLAETHHLIPLTPFILARLGAAQRALFALEDACVTHLAGLEADEVMPSHPFSEMLHAELCADYALADDWEAAYTHARQALAVRNYSLLYLGLHRWYETEALLRGGDIGLARADIHRFGMMVEDPDHGNNNSRFRIPYLRSLAVLAEWDSDVGQAITHLQEAHHLTEELELPGEQWQILVKLGELYRANSDMKKMRQAFGEVAEIIQAFVANLDKDLQTKFLETALVRRVLTEL